jgi:hypothetical protein
MHLFVVLVPFAAFVVSLCVAVCCTQRRWKRQGTRVCVSEQAMRTSLRWTVLLSALIYCLGLAYVASFSDLAADEGGRESNADVSAFFAIDMFAIQVSVCVRVCVCVIDDIISLILPPSLSVSAAPMHTYTYYRTLSTPAS